MNSNQDELHHQETQQAVMSFIVKIWLEQNAEELPQQRWHGYIVQVPAGRRMYLHRLGDISPFIQRHLHHPVLKEDLAVFQRNWAVGKSHRKRKRLSNSPPKDSIDLPGNKTGL